MAEIVRRRSFGAVLPLGRHISISGSRPIQCASDSIALSSFQEKQNARHYKQFKFEQALSLVLGFGGALVIRDVVETTHDRLLDGSVLAIAERLAVEDN